MEGYLRGLWYWADHSRSFRLATSRLTVSGRITASHRGGATGGTLTNQLFRLLPTPASTHKPGLPIRWMMVFPSTRHCGLQTATQLYTAPSATYTHESTRRFLLHLLLASFLPAPFCSSSSLRRRIPSLYPLPRLLPLPSDHVLACPGGPTPLLSPIPPVPGVVGIGVRTLPRWATPRNGR